MAPTRTRTTQPTGTGHKSSEYRLAWMIPTATALLALVLEWADKLPAWAKTPGVLVAGMACATALGVAYIVSRGLAKHEVRDPGMGSGGEPPPVQRP